MDNDDLMSMPCLIMQYKPYIVELPTKEAYFKKICSYCSTSTIHRPLQNFSEFFQGVSAIACTLK